MISSCILNTYPYTQGLILDKKSPSRWVLQEPHFVKKMVKTDNKICKWVVQDALFTTEKNEQFKSSIVRQLNIDGGSPYSKRLSRLLHFSCGGLKGHVFHRHIFLPRQGLFSGDFILLTVLSMRLNYFVRLG